jgi:hypothetical protein
MMRACLVAAAFGAAALYGVSAQAFPASSQLGLSSGEGNVIQVAEGCGRGWHRGPAGHCRRNTSPAQGACWFVRGPGGAWHMVCR